MNSGLPTEFFDLRRKLEAAAVFHRVGSVRQDAVLVEVRLPKTFWEIEFLSDGRVLYEVFTSTGPILDALGLIGLVARRSDRVAAMARADLPRGELAVMQLLREAGISFSADEMLMRKVTIDGAVMIEAAVPGERWEIDVRRNGEIEVERFQTGEGVHDFDAEALRRLLAAAGEAPPPRRKALRGAGEGRK